MVGPRTARIARNENAFRALNESLEANVHRRRSANDLAGFVCECGDADCDATVRLDLPTYESIRRDARLFVTLPGHDVRDVEDVVRDGEDYIIVRKHADAAEILEPTRPRRESS